MRERLFTHLLRDRLRDARDILLRERRGVGVAPVARLRVSQGLVLPRGVARCFNVSPRAEQLHAPALRHRREPRRRLLGVEGIAREPHGVQLGGDVAHLLEEREFGEEAGLERVRALSVRAPRSLLLRERRGEERRALVQGFSRVFFKLEVIGSSVVNESVDIVARGALRGEPIRGEPLADDGFVFGRTSRPSVARGLLLPTLLPPSARVRAREGRVGRRRADRRDDVLEVGLRGGLGERRSRRAVRFRSRRLLRRRLLRLRRRDWKKRLESPPRVRGQHAAGFARISRHARWLGGARAFMNAFVVVVAPERIVRGTRRERLQ